MPSDVMPRLFAFSAIIGLPVMLALNGCHASADHYRSDDARALAPDSDLSPQRWNDMFDDAAPADTPEQVGMQQKLAEAAGAQVGKRAVRMGEKSYRADCSGTARGIYATAGFPLHGTAEAADENDVSIIFRYVKEAGALHKNNPRPGDLVFFDNTYDRNQDGSLNDELSHIGVVESVLDDGTVVFVHRVSGRILRYRMNLDVPTVRRDDAGLRKNHFLRRANRAGEAATTAQLFRSYGTLPAPAPETPFFASLFGG